MEGDNTLLSASGKQNSIHCSSWKKEEEKWSTRIWNSYTVKVFTCGVTVVNLNNVLTAGEFDVSDTRKRDCGSGFCLEVL